jgi:hypothetical protein
MAALAPFRRGSFFLGTFDVVIRTNCAHRIDMWDDDGKNIIEHLANIQDFELALGAYQFVLSRWPNASLTLRQGTRVIEDSRKSPPCHWGR